MKLLRKCFWSLLGVLLLGLVQWVHAGVYITLPSASDGCGSLQSDSYFWDTMDDPASVANLPRSSTDPVPKGNKIQRNKIQTKTKKQNSKKSIWYFLSLFIFFLQSY